MRSQDLRSSACVTDGVGLSSEVGLTLGGGAGLTWGGGAHVGVGLTWGWGK